MSAETKAATPTRRAYEAGARPFLAWCTNCGQGPNFLVVAGVGLLMTFYPGWIPIGLVGLLGRGHRS